MFLHQKRQKQNIYKQKLHSQKNYRTT